MKTVKHQLPRKTYDVIGIEGNLKVPKYLYDTLQVGAKCRICGENFTITYGEYKSGNVTHKHPNRH